MRHLSVQIFVSLFNTVHSFSEVFLECLLRSLFYLIWEIMRLKPYLQQETFLALQSLTKWISLSKRKLNRVPIWTCAFIWIKFQCTKFVVDKNDYSSYYKVNKFSPAFKHVQALVWMKGRGGGGMQILLSALKKTDIQPVFETCKLPSKNKIVSSTLTSSHFVS